MLKKLITNTLMILCLSMIVASTVAGQETLPDDTIEEISRSVVRITVERSSSDLPIIGSGVVISDDGFILTALELVNYDDVEKITISTYTQVDLPPEEAYLAEVLFPSPMELGSIELDPEPCEEEDCPEADLRLNLAVLRVSATLDGNLINRAELSLDRVVYWTEELTNTNRVYIFAYTEIIGNGNITADGGVVATDVGELREFRSDNIFDEGASGGLIINEFGEMVGIATSIIEDEGQIATLTRFLPLSYICQEEPDVCDLLPTGPPPVRTVTRAVVCIGINDILNLRDAPSRNGEVVERMTFGDHVAIIGTSTPNDGFSWIEIQTSDGNQGWAAEVINNARTLIPYTSEISGEREYPITIGNRAIVCVPPVSISVNLRRSPAGFSEKQLLMGSVVDVVSGPVQQDGALWWSVVDRDGDTGWVAEVDDGVAILIGLPD